MPNTNATYAQPYAPKRRCACVGGTVITVYVAGVGDLCIKCGHAPSYR